MINTCAIYLEKFIFFVYNDSHLSLNHQYLYMKNIEESQFVHLQLEVLTAFLHT